jgi:hypothetical protein
MNKVPCPELCADCPLRSMLSVEPEYLEVVGSRTLPEVSYGNVGGNSVSIGIEYGAGPKQLEVALTTEASKTGPAFWLREGVWRSGVVQQAFEDCSQPTQLRSGFLKLSKQAVCGALANIK